MQYNAISVTAEKVSAPKPIPIPMVSADTFGRYRISVGHYLWSQFCNSDHSDNGLPFKAKQVTPDKKQKFVFSLCY